MRMLLEFELPVEPFNSMVRDGTAGQKLQEILGEIKPEAAYFTERDGHRGGILVVDLADPSQVPRLAEPFFLVFKALVKFRVCMTPEDLGRAGLEAIGSRYA
jgi:hypothetical protein